MAWFAARLLHVILVDDKKPRKRRTHDETCVVFRARDSAHAIKRALSLGRDGETEYRNVYGQRVRWAFVEIVTLDRIGERLEGREVYSRLHDRVDAKPLTYRRKFHPERSKPGISGI